MNGRLVTPFVFRAELKDTVTGHSNSYTNHKRVGRPVLRTGRVSTNQGKTTYRVHQPPVR